MLLPPVVLDINEASPLGFNWGGGPQTSMSAMLVVIALILSQLVRQVGGSPEKGLI
jgi:hypothetical protein